MPLVCTESATITCPHGGTVTLSGKGNSKSKVDSVAVLTSTSIIGAVISNCPNSPPANKCTAVASAVGSTKSVVDSSGVVHATSTIVLVNTGLGPQPGTVASAGQTKYTVSA